MLGFKDGLIDVNDDGIDVSMTLGTEDCEGIKIMVNLTKRAFQISTYSSFWDIINWHSNCDKTE